MNVEKKKKVVAIVFVAMHQRDRYLVHAMVDEEEAEGGGDGAVVRRVEVDGLGED